ncbi:hypothetical protein HMPREF9261_1790 [Finegoldia magna ACS-171-V-Col3]|nr:hypothetical protein HMPREF9261_1790 [Finegoldia magna ACS-171-V-Col3]KXA10329.1 hypothetical protein HMPREF3217_00515 [Finegoldia magna]
MLISVDQIFEQICSYAIVIHVFQKDARIFASIPANSSFNS